MIRTTTLLPTNTNCLYELEINSKYEWIIHRDQLTKIGKSDCLSKKYLHKLSSEK